MKNLSKKEAEVEIGKFFLTKHDKESVRKIKKLAMNKRIRLGELRKKFCSKCYNMSISVKRIKRGIRSVECNNCGNVMRWKISA
jgi:RNase P subunit RPR2